MISAITAFDGEKIASLANDIAKNCYIIIGIFALFRIALILVNTNMLLYNVIISEYRLRQIPYFPIKIDSFSLK